MKKYLSSIDGRRGGETVTIMRPVVSLKNVVNLRNSYRSGKPLSTSEIIVNSTCHCYKSRLSYVQRIKRLESILLVPSQPIQKSEQHQPVRRPAVPSPFIGHRARDSPHHNCHHNTMMRKIMSSSIWSVSRWLRSGIDAWTLHYLYAP
jgi:hypothetical protein